MLPNRNSIIVTTVEAARAGTEVAEGGLRFCAGFVGASVLAGTYDAMVSSFNAVPTSAEVIDSALTMGSGVIAVGVFIAGGRVLNVIGSALHDVAENTKKQ